jgi:hypothetical protein
MQNVLITFAKAPVLGRVKTRLVPPLTYEQSYALHQAFIEDTLNKISRLPDIKPCLGYYPRGQKHKFNGMLPVEIDLFCQAGNDLGERMQNALKRYLKQAQQVVIIGADVPSLPEEYIQQAFEQLVSHDIVIGPAEDGGYYLIGSKADPPDIFSNIPWGTEKVFESTRIRLKQSGCKYAILPSWPDIDRPEDLYHLHHYLIHNPHRLPATRRVMADCWAG